MSNKIYLIKTEHSNGFPYVDCEVFDDYETAIKRKSELEDESINTGLYDIEDDVEPDDLEFHADSNNMSGNAVDIEIVSEDEMMSVIMDAVDESDKKHILEYFGETEYKMEVPMYEVCWDNALLCWDEEEDLSNDEFEVKYIIRRPYDFEHPQGTDYVYDIHMVRHYGGFSEDENGSEYTESLECIGSELLAHIYCDIKGM